MKRVIIALLLLLFVICIVDTASFIISMNRYYLDEPTHTMTEEEMLQVCIEEGIPLDD